MMLRRFLRRTIRDRVASSLGLVEVEKLRVVEGLVEDQRKLSHTAWNLLRSSQKKFEKDIEELREELLNVRATSEIVQDVVANSTTQSTTYDEDDELEIALTEISSHDMNHQEDVDPTFGRLLMDLGYKRVYATPLKNLMNRELIPFWRKNRVFRQDRSKKIAKDILKSLAARGKDVEKIGFPGVVSVFEAKWNDEIETGVLDGQHRIGAFVELYEDGHVSEEDEVLVEVLPVEASSSNEDKKIDVDSMICSLFKEINMAEPVKLVDLPSAEKAAESERQILNEAAERLKETFPDMFRASQRCRIPHVNIDNLRDMVFQARVVKRNKITSSDELFQWFLDRNEMTSDLTEDREWLNRSRRLARRGGSTGIMFEKALTKSKTKKFYLGLTNEWVDMEQQ
jgi:hypothetical protein